MKKSIKLNGIKKNRDIIKNTTTKIRKEKTLRRKTYYNLHKKRRK